MPVTPRSARPKSYADHDASISADTAAKLKPQGLYESNNVQDRIRQWQTQGAASALDPDAISVRSRPTSECGSDCSRAQSPAEPIPRSAPNRRGRWTEREKENVPASRDASTNSAPRKRLVSDEHWKSKREQRNRAPPRTVPKESIATPHHDLSYTSTPKKEEREARRERRRQDRLSRDRERGVSQEPLDMPATPAAIKELDSYIDEELARHLSTPSLQDISVRDDPDAGASKYGQSLAEANDIEPTKGRSKGAAVFFKTKEIFGRYEKPVPASNRVPSIEAWLHEQPDPFVDTPVEAVSPGVEAPEPLRKRTRRSRRSSASAAPDPNEIWDSVTIQDADHNTKPAPQRDASWSYGDEIPNQERKPATDTPLGSPADLRRSSARTRRSRHERPSPRTSSNINSPEIGADARTPQRETPSRPHPPTSGHKLSAIASVETFQEQNEPPSYDIMPQLEGPGLKRKLTTHDDLMSVLSLPMNRRSTRSRRHAKSPPSQSAAEVLSVLVAEEEKYGKELRTLVDGVVPVLLQCVLSKSNSVAAAGLFTSSISGEDDLAFTKPIIDMGVALERLKTLHNRIPLQSLDSLLGWAHTAQKAYKDYLTAWRLGFQDVVVNLAPLDSGKEVEGMSRDAEGDVVNTKGEKVDVAYLLKRPLVRVNNLSKTFELIKEHSDRSLAKEAAAIFADLTALARQRHQAEQARLEDEGAARIDASRTRDLRTLAATTKASIDTSRRVRARDCFNLTIYHSTGQRMDCRVEMIIRDNASGSPSGGDVLICEMDESGKWLLFPPIGLHSISARRAEQKFDLVLMVRGPSGIGQEWHELIALTGDSGEAATEWLSMLGSSPLPPKLNRTQSFQDSAKATPIVEPSVQPRVEIPPSLAPSDIDVPLGEPSVLSSPERPTPKGRSNNPFEKFMPRLNLGGGLRSKPQASWPRPEKHVRRKPVPSTISSDRSTISDKSVKDLPELPKPWSAPNTPPHTPRPQSSYQHQAKRGEDGLYMMSGGLSPDQPASHSAAKDRSTRSDRGQEPPLDTAYVPVETMSAPTSPAASTQQRPGFARKLSATPSMELPTVNKLRTASDQNQDPISTPLNESIRDQWNAMSGNGQSRRRSGQKSASTGQIYTEDIPAPPSQDRNRPPPTSANPIQPIEPVPAPPPHRRRDSNKQDTKLVSVPEPQLKPTPKKDTARKRRSSSPLKHEYAPSTGSESSSDSESDYGSDATSDTSEDFMSETKDVAMPLVAVTGGNRRSSKIAQQQHAPPPPSTAQTTGTRTLAPSDSASQGPYRTVPPSQTIPSNRKSRTIAMVCAWSEKGVWEQIYPDECSIVISPGLIEAFEMTAAHSGPNGQSISESDSRTSSLTQQPLVAFELTPIVPLRRGTALDINIRSPPTANSKLKTTSNIMFRSRIPEECDALYSMINWARCNNPAYIQLQSARPKQQPNVTFNTGQNTERRKSSSWFSFGGIERRSSYRATSAPAGVLPSIGGDSEATTGTVNSAFSALKRLGVSSAFNLNRSSVHRKSGMSRASGSLYSSDSGTRTGSGSSTPIPSQVGLVPGRDGPNVPETSAEAANGGGMVNNMKIRLYLRKNQAWENLGAGRLTVMPAEDFNPKQGSGSSTPTGATTPRAPSGGVVGLPGQRGPRLASSNNTPHRIHGNGREKRIMIRKNKDTEVIMLDATLGESCFERVMQTGIAVKVWSEDEQIGQRGGVVMGRERVYMMQFPGTREAGWVFGLCGSYRYGEMNG